MLLLTIFLYRCFPIAISITSFASAYIIVSNIKKNGQLNAFSALGLNPSNLFTPLLFISTALSLLNLAITLILSPLINTTLRSTLNTKKDQIEILESFTRKFSKNNRYINIKNLPNNKEGLDFILIQNQENFSWLISDKVEEHSNNLKFINPSYFKIEEEDKGFNSILLSEDSSIILPKKSIFSILPYSTLNIDPINLSKTKITSNFLCSFYPLAFSILGIILALNIYNIFSAFVFLQNIILLILSSIILSSILNLLLIFNFLLICPFYFFVLYKHKRGFQ